MMTTSTIVEEGVQLFLDHIPSIAEQDRWRSVFERAGCTQVDVFYRERFGRERYFEAAVSGDHDAALTLDEEDWRAAGWDGPTPQLLTPSVDVQYEDPFATPPPQMFDEIVWRERDPSLRCERFVLRNTQTGESIDILLRRKDVMRMATEVG